jgi:SAM-dependent methyltransferase
VFKAGPVEITRLEVLNQDGAATAAFQPMDSMTVRVHYRCDGQLPQETLGLAMAINRSADLFPVMQCSMTNPMSYEDSAAYQHAPFRLRPGRAGWVQGRIKPLQLAPGEYILSVGLLPNIANSWEFYEYHHFSYTFVVTTGVSSTGGLIYPLVSWEHRPSRNGELPKVDAGALAEVPVANAGARQGALTTPSTKAPPPGGYDTLREEIQDLCFNIGGYPDAWPRHRQCPCCASTSLAPLFKKYEIEHWVCQACEFVFVNPYPPDDLVGRIYNASYYPAVREFIELPRAQAGREDAALFSTPLEVLDRIIATVAADQPSGEWLDVGGGIGTFAHRIQKKLPSWRVVLNELNSRAHQIAQEVFHLETTTRSPRDLVGQGRRFDAVSLMSVLEHISDPLPFLTDCVDLLAPGGHLVISVPRFTRLNRLISRENNDNVVPPYHVSLFNDANLCLLLKRAGLADGMQVWNDGPPAFQLIDFVHRWSYWDVRVPREPREAPEGIVVKPIPEDVSRMIAALAEADKHVRDFSARSDGGVYLTVIATKP